MIVTLRRCYAAGAVAFVLCQPLHASEVEAPLQKFFPAAENGVPGSYGVSLFAADYASAAADIVDSVGGTLGYVYRFAVVGFQATLTELQAEELSQHPWVRYVIQEEYVEEPLSHVLQDCFEVEADYDTDTRLPLPPLPNSAVPVQTQTLECSNPAPPDGDCIDNWGLDRIDRVGPEALDEEFRYRQAAGNVTAFVIDTGVAFSNREFRNPAQNSRVAEGLDTFCDDFPGDCPPGSIPCEGTWNGQGHGTHVAAIIGGRTFGLAKDIDIYPIKALCFASDQTYTTEHYKRAFEAVLSIHGPTQPTAVVNLSGLNGLSSCHYNPPCPSQVREAALNVARSDNVLLVQSAGNQEQNDACNHTFGDEDDYTDDPNNEYDDHDAAARILIAAGSNHGDGRWHDPDGEDGFNGSNIGPCVDIFAPAGLVASAFFPADPGTQDPDEIVCRLSGTSMAAPHVSGVAALILHNSPTLSSRGVRALILNSGERNILETNTNSPYYIGNGSPNLLLHWDPSDIFRDGFETVSVEAWSGTS